MYFSIFSMFKYNSLGAESVTSNVMSTFTEVNLHHKTESKSLHRLFCLVIPQVANTYAY